MKATQEQIEQLRAGIAPAIAQYPKPDAKLIASGYTEHRWRLDILHFSKSAVSTLYRAGLNADHIDTALRAITGTK